MFSRKKDKKEKVKEEKLNEKSSKTSSKKKSKPASKHSSTSDSPSSASSSEVSFTQQAPPSNLSGYAPSGYSYTQGGPVYGPGIVPQNGYIPPPQQNGYGIMPNGQCVMPNGQPVMPNGYGVMPNGQVVNQNGMVQNGFINQGQPVQGQIFQGQQIPQGGYVLPGYNGYPGQEGVSNETANHKYGAKNLKLFEDEKEKKRGRKDRRGSDIKSDKSSDKGSDKHSERKREKSSDRKKDKRDKTPDRKRDKSNERKRDKSSDRKRDKSSDRKREKSSDRKRDKSSDRKRDKSTDRKREKSSDRKTGKNEKKSEKHTDKKSDKKADKKSEKLSDKKKKDEKKDKKSDKKQDKKNDKISDKVSDQNTPKASKGGILKKPKSDNSERDSPAFAYYPQGAVFDPSLANQVTFAGPDNRVHQSVVNVQQPMQYQPDILPSNYQSNTMTNGGQYHDNSVLGNPVTSPMTTHITSPHGVINSNIPAASNQSYNQYGGPSRDDPYTTAAHIQNLSLSPGGPNNRHIASVDIGTLQRPGTTPNTYAQQNSAAQGYSYHGAGMARAQGGMPGNSNMQHNGRIPHSTPSPAQHNKGAAPQPPIVLGEVNIPNISVPPQQNQRDAYARFDQMVERAHEEEIKYAQLLFDQHNKPINGKSKASTTKGLKKERIANYTIEMDSDEENENPLRLRGILKPPKRVEFNKDVDVTLFGNMHSRHESLESLFYPDPNIMAHRASMNRKQHAPQQPAYQYVEMPATPQTYQRPPPPTYAQVIHERPLDDTDLHMYTIRRRRPPPMPRAVYDGTLRRMRHQGSLRASGGRSGRGTVRTIRMMPGNHHVW